MAEGINFGSGLAVTQETNYLTVDLDTSQVYSDEDAQDAVGTIMGSFFNYDDANNTITFNEGNINHDNIDQSTVSSDDHHSKTSSASELTDVSADSVSDAHHTKTSSASDLTDVSPDSNADAHHTDPTAGAGVTDEGSNQFGLDVILSDQVQLSSGSAVVDTTISATDATFMLAIGVDDPDADTKISGRLFWDDSAGTYKIEFVEQETSVGNPTANYDIVRVR